MEFPGFIGATYQSRSASFDAERCINLYVEAGESGQAKNTAMLLGAPGLQRYCLFPTAAGVRGLYTASRGRVFAVAGISLYEIFAGGTFIERGTLSTQYGPVSMSDNGLHLLIVDGSPAGYAMVFETNIFVVLHSPGFLGADRVAFFDGFFVLNHPGTEQFYISGLFDGLHYDSLDFASMESNPDLLITLEVQNANCCFSARAAVNYGSMQGLQISPLPLSRERNSGRDVLPGILCKIFIGSDRTPMGLAWCTI